MWIRSFLHDGDRFSALCPTNVIRSALVSGLGLESPSKSRQDTTGQHGRAERTGGIDTGTAVPTAVCLVWVRALWYNP